VTDRDQIAQQVAATFDAELKEFRAEIEKNPAISQKLINAFSLGANIAAQIGGMQIKPLIEDFNKRLALLEAERLPNPKRKARPEPTKNVFAIALYMRDHPEQTQEEIAEGLEYALATVRRYSNRARKLAKLLESGTIEI